MIFPCRLIISTRDAFSQNKFTFSVAGFGKTFESFRVPISFIAVLTHSITPTEHGSPFKKTKTEFKSVEQNCPDKKFYLL